MASDRQVDDGSGTVHAVQRDALAIVVKHGDLSADPVDGQVRPDRLADVVYTGLEDLVRSNHALGPYAAEMLRSRGRPHRQQIRHSRRTSKITLDAWVRLAGGWSGGRVEEGTEELKAAAEWAVQRPRQLGPVGELAVVWHQKLVNVVEHDVAAGRHLSIETVLDGQRLPVVPNAVDDLLRKSPVYDVDPTSTPVATPGGVIANKSASVWRRFPVVDDDVIGAE